MPKRPVRDATPLSDDERPLVDDLIAVMERALARRRKLVHKPLTVPRFYLDTGRAESVVMYQNLAGDDPITAEDYERTRGEREEELRALERALLPIAKVAFKPGRNKGRPGAKLIELFRPDVHPNGPLEVGAFAATSGIGWIENEDDCWERFVTWGERCRDGTHDRDVAAGVCHKVLCVLKNTYGAFTGAVPSAEQLKHEFMPATDEQRQRGPNSIAAATCELVDDLSKDTILRAVERSNEQANRVYEFDAEGRPTTCRLLGRKDWVGRTVQQERLRIMFHPMTFPSWDGAPAPRVPEEWEEYDTAEQRRRRLKNYRWEGSTLMPIDRQLEPEST